MNFLKFLIILQFYIILHIQSIDIQSQYQPTCSDIPGQFWNLQQCLYCKNSKCFCTDIDTCTRCIDGYYLDKIEKDCLKCPIGCSQCCRRKSISHLVCTECFEDFLLLSGACIKQTNCIDINELGHCNECQEGYYINNEGSCTSCDISCNQCISQYQCLKCNDGYYTPSSYDSSLDLNCRKCQYENSKICEGNNGELIKQCIDGYYLQNPDNSELNTCKQCYDLCQHCTEFESCIQGYCVTKAFQFNGCTFPCRADSSQKCGGSWYNNLFEIKEDGTIKDLGCWRDGRDEYQLRSLDCKFRNKETFLPLECAEACKVNNSDGQQCDVYEGDYDHDGVEDPVINPASYKYAGIQFFGECLCGNRDVDVFKFGNGNGKQCEHCNTVNSRFGVTVDQCNLCDLEPLRLELDESLCQDIDCQDVREKRPTCTLCNDGYYIDEYGQCLKCPYDAIKCTSITHIIQCKEGEILVTDVNYLTACVQNIEVYDCSNISIAHDINEIKYFDQIDSQLTCMECLPYVINRDPVTNEQIQEGLVYFYKTDEKRCLKCNIEFCFECTHLEDDDTVGCSKCVDLYTVNYTQDQCLKCPDNCLQCKATKENVVQCTQCSDTYQINEDYQCQICEIQNCQQCSQDLKQCIVCMPGYGLQDADGNGCLRCQKGCKQCDLDSSLCISCIDGYYWKQFVCYPQSHNCLKSNNNGYCILCQSSVDEYDQDGENYIINSDIHISYKGKCIDCSNYESGAYTCPDKCLNFEIYTVNSIKLIISLLNMLIALFIIIL